MTVEPPPGGYGVSYAFLSRQRISPHAVDMFDAAEGNVMRDPAWRAWYDAHVESLDETGDGFRMVCVEDRERLKVLVRGDRWFLYLPAGRLAGDDETLRGQFEQILRHFYRVAAARAGLPAPPGSAAEEWVSEP